MIDPVLLTTRAWAIVGQVADSDEVPESIRTRAQRLMNDVETVSGRPITYSEAEVQR